MAASEPPVDPHHGPNPRTWPEALEWFVWGTLIFSCGVVVIESVVVMEWGRAFAALVLGLVLVAVALHWQRVSPNWIVPCAVVLLLTIILSPFVEQRRWPFAWLVESLHSSPSAQEVAAAAPMPPKLSEDEKQLREETRKFVLTNLNEQMTLFGQTIFDVGWPNHGKDNSPTAQAAGNLLDAAMRGSYSPAERKIKADAQKSSDNMDLKEIGDDLKDYYEQYAKAQDYLKSYLMVTGRTPNGDDVQKWLDADDSVRRAYSSLLSFPLARESGLAVDIGQTNDYFRSYLRPKN